MKLMRAVLAYTLLLIITRADSVFYHATPGPTDRFQSSTYAILGGDILEQPFTPQLATIDVLDFSFDVGTGGAIEVVMREGDQNGPIIASQRLQASPTDEFGRRRMVFNAPVSVMAGTPHLLQLIAAPRPNPNDVVLYGYYFHGFLPPGERSRKNGLPGFWALDYGLGVLIPNILPAPREPVVYVEQSPPVPLFSDAIITNDFFFGAAHLQIAISNDLFPGNIFVASTTNTPDYVDNYWITNPTGYPYRAIFHVLLRSNTTPAGVQDVLRRVRFQNVSDELRSSLEDLSLTYSNAVGQSQATAQLQLFGVNDPPVADFYIPYTATFWPDTNHFAVAPRARRPALVYFDLSFSSDPDMMGASFVLTHQQDPGWEITESSFKSLPIGLHQFTLTAIDEQSTNSLTREIEVITVARALQLWKKSVRGIVSDRQDRVALLKPLTAAQLANAQGQRPALFTHIDRFLKVARDRNLYPTPEYGWTGNYYAIANANAVYPPP